MSIIGDVTTYFETHENKACSIKQMSNELGYTERQIRASIANKKFENGEWASHLTVLVSGQVYKWHPESVSVTESSKQKTNLYEQIGTTKNGDLILQDEDGVLFRATELN